MISTYTALFDANVLFGARLRSLLMELAMGGLFRARWRADIHREWMEAVLRKRPGLTMAQLEPTRAAMDAAAPDGCVNGYEGLIPALQLPDPKDRHVLAAAIRCKASVIVTFNEKDFPAEALAPFAIGTKHPDDFILEVEDMDAGTLIDAARHDHRHYKAPRLAIERYIDDLRLAGIPKAAARLEDLKILFAEP